MQLFSVVEQHGWHVSARMASWHLRTSPRQSRVSGRSSGLWILDSGLRTVDSGQMPGTFPRFCICALASYALFPVIVAIVAFACCLWSDRLKMWNNMPQQWSDSCSNSCNEAYECWLPYEMDIKQGRRWFSSAKGRDCSARLAYYAIACKGAPNHNKWQPIVPESEPVTLTLNPKKPKASWKEMHLAKRISSKLLFKIILKTKLNWFYTLIMYKKNKTI